MTLQDITEQQLEVVKTLLERVIDEANHYISHYKHWGVIAPNGEKIDGQTHPKAKIHSDLISTHSKKTGLNKKHYLEYAHLDHPNEELKHTIIRGHLNKPTVRLAQKHFDDIPHHENGKVIGEFGEKGKIKARFRASDHQEAKEKLQGLANTL